jgi:uncharacterized protein YndB with AHSA1/START domain
MTIQSVDRDAQALTLTLTSTFDSPVDKVWQMWDDPRQLEKWWGPPTYPATVVVHELSAGGRVRYFMTGPNGEHAPGFWNVTLVDPPHRLEFENGIAGDDGEPLLDMPRMMMRVDIEETSSDATSMKVVATFPSTAAMEQFLSMGMEEGIKGSMSQLDALL